MRRSPVCHADLIYDLGAHTGEDTDFYLGKGFRVVAVEANPKLVRHLLDRFPGHAADGRLVVVDKVIGVGLPRMVTFFVNEQKDDWSSLDRDIASKGVHAITEVSASSTTLGDLFTRHGIPRYLKVDIEGGDTGVAEALLSQPHRPDYVSFEWHEFRLAAVLEVAGYRSFQIINQYLKPLSQQRCVPPREGGDYWVGRSTGMSSGQFGKELPESGWVSFEEVVTQWLAYRELTKTADLAPGWLDLHARL